MPDLVRLYIRSIAVGLGLALVFSGALVGLDIAGVGRLILGSDVGWIAAAMLVIFNGIAFAGVQFALALVPPAKDNGGGRGAAEPARVRVQREGRRARSNREDRGFPESQRSQVGTGYPDQDPGRASPRSLAYRPLENWPAREEQHPPRQDIGRGSGGCKAGHVFTLGSSSVA